MDEKSADVEESRLEGVGRSSETRLDRWVKSFVRKERGEEW